MTCVTYQHKTNLTATSEARDGASFGINANEDNWRKLNNGRNNNNKEFTNIIEDGVQIAWLKDGTNKKPNEQENKLWRMNNVQERRAKLDGDWNKWKQRR